MSALPTPPDPSTFPREIQDGILGVTIGATSWLVRYACSTEKQSLGYIARRTATAGLTALLVGTATSGYFNNPSIGFGAAGCAAYCSPELVDYALSELRKRTAKGKLPPTE